MIAAGSAVALGWDPRTDPVASVVFLISLSIARGRRVRAAAKWHPLRHPLQVVLQAAIDRQGRVLWWARFWMTEAAADAVRGWRFRPAWRGGQPVAVYYQLTVRLQQAR